ncbi:MAG: tetratricopeptide repeat protein [Bacteroidia bacterium]
MTFISEIESRKKHIDELNEEAYEQRYNNPTLTLQLGKDVEKMAQEIGYRAGVGWALRNQAIGYAILGQAQEASSAFKRALEVFQAIGNIKAEGLLLTNLGTLHQTLGELDIALDYLVRGAKLLKNAPEYVPFYAQALGNLGSIYAELEQYEVAIEYHQEALRIQEQLNNPRGAFFSLISLGSIYRLQGEDSLAETYQKKAWDAALETGDKDIMCRALIAHSEYLIQKEQHQEALSKLEKAAHLAQEIASKERLAIVTLYLADVYIKLGDVEKAESYLSQAERLTEEVHTVASFYLPELRARLAILKQDYKTAYEEQQGATQKRLSILRSINKQLVEGLKRLFVSEKEEKEAEIRRLREVELRQALEAAEAQAQELASHIEYAAEIQRAVFHQESELQKHLPQSFYVYHAPYPVHGNFIWTYQVEGRRFVILGDAAGQGVPAALLSTVVYMLLQEAVHNRQIMDPGKVLSYIHNGLRKLFSTRPTQIPRSVQMAVCILDPPAPDDTYTLFFAGAGRNLWIAPRGEWTEIAGDLMLVGDYQKEAMRIYTTHSILCPKGTAALLFTDGVDKLFADKLNTFISQLNAPSIPGIKEMLRKEIDNYKAERAFSEELLAVGWIV